MWPPWEIQALDNELSVNFIIENIKIFIKMNYFFKDFKFQTQPKLENLLDKTDKKSSS